VVIETIMFELVKNEPKNNESLKNELSKSEQKPSNRKQNANYLFKYLLVCNFLQYLEAGAVPALLIELENTFGMSSGQQVLGINAYDLTIDWLLTCIRDCWVGLYTFHCP